MNESFFNSDLGITVLGLAAVALFWALAFKAPDVVRNRVRPNAWYSMAWIGVFVIAGLWFMKESVEIGLSLFETDVPNEIRQLAMHLILQVIGVNICMTGIAVLGPIAAKSLDDPPKDERPMVAAEAMDGVVASYERIVNATLAKIPDAGADEAANLLEEAASEDS